jgi:hypothetical protein
MRSPEAVRFTDQRRLRYRVAAGDPEIFRPRRRNDECVFCRDDFRTETTSRQHIASRIIRSVIRMSCYYR